MFLQLASDLHLEFYTSLDQIPEIPVSHPSAILCLCGDIGYPGKDLMKQFLLHQAQRFQKVLLIAGNHEYYCSNVDVVKQELDALNNLHPNLLYLNKSSYVHVDSDTQQCYKFLGCTLWTQIEPEDASFVSRTMNDYHLVKIREDKKLRRLSIDDTNAWHVEHLAWLKQQIASANANEKLIILTHHAPIKQGTSAANMQDSQLQVAFASNLDDLMGEQVVAWCFGHTHHSCVIKHEKGTIIMANQLGYQKKNDNTGYNPAFVYQL